MVALAFMSTESSYLIRGAMGKSLWESAGPSTSPECGRCTAGGEGRRRRKKNGHFLASRWSVSCLYKPDRVTGGWLSPVFFSKPGECASSIWREFRKWPQMVECQPNIAATVDLFVPSKRPKAFNNVWVVPIYPPFPPPSQLRLTQKVIDKVKMLPTESLLAIACVQRSGCPEWKWLTWLAPGDAHPCIQSH